MSIEDTPKKDEKKDPLTIEAAKTGSKSQIRFGWLDQFRGLVILLFIIQTLAWATVNEFNFPILAPHLNHGYKYAQVTDWPPIITLIDCGQQIFIFMVGYMAAFSVIKMRQKGVADKAIWIRIARRFLAVMILNVIHMAVSGDMDAYSLSFDSTLGYIAWAGLAAAVLTMLIPKTDIRFLIGLIPFFLQIILDLSIVVENRWLELLGLVGIAIVASAYTGWMLKGDGTVDESSFKPRVLPVTMGMFGAMYIIEFFQWADHHGSTVALCAMSIGISGIAVFMFYYMEKNGYKSALLTPFGKNMLIIFLLEMVVIELLYMDMFMFDFVAANLDNPFLLLIFVGIIPIAILWVIAKLLEKKGWYLRV